MTRASVLSAKAVATSDAGKDIIKGEQTKKADIKELSVQWAERDTHLKKEETVYAFRWANFKD